MPHYIAEGMGRAAGETRHRYALPPITFEYDGPDGQTLKDVARKAFKVAGYRNVKITRVYVEVK